MDRTSTPQSGAPAPAPAPKRRLSITAWVLIGVAGGLVLVGALVASIFIFVWSATSAPVAATDAFLAQVGKGEYETAYRSAAPQFRAQLSLAAFTAAMKRYGLDKYASASWPSRTISPGRTVLLGTVRTRDGGTIPARVVLVGADKDWKVYGIRVELAGVGAISGDTPDTEAVRKLVLATLLKFNDAVQSGDFGDFHASLARPMREKYSADQLKTTFGAFVRNRIDLAGIRDVPPVFNPSPYVDDRGHLHVSGYYPTTPLRVSFTLGFVKHEDDWKLISIDVAARRP